MYFFFVSYSYLSYVSPSTWQDSLFKNPYQFSILSIAGLTQKAQDYKELLWNSCIGSRPHWPDYDSATNDTGRGMHELKIAKNRWKTPKTSKRL